MEKSTFQQSDPALTYPEERGLFKGLGTPPVLNAFLLAFVAYVFFIFGAWFINWVADRTAPDEPFTYERLVYNVRSWISRVPGGGRAFDLVARPVLLVRSGGEMMRDVARRRLAYEQKMADEWRETCSAANPGRPAPPMTEKFRKDYEAKNPPPPRVGEFNPASAPWWAFLAYGLWFLVMWSLFAGAINRVYAFRIGRDETITLSEALAFGLKTFFTHFFSGLLIAVIIAAMFWLVVGLVALFGSIPYFNYFGHFVVIIGLPFVLVAGFIIALLVVGLMFCFNMISSAIAAEYTDPFDAVSRAYSYILERPWHTLLYTFLTVAFVGIFLFFGAFALDSAESMLNWGLGDGQYGAISNYMGDNYISTVSYKEAFAGKQWSLMVLGIVTRFLFWLVHVFIFAAAIAFWLGSRMKAYLLLRHEVDGDEPDEIYLEEEEEPLEEIPSPAAEEKAEAAAEKVEEKKEAAEEKKEEKPKEEVKEEPKEEPKKEKKEKAEEKAEEKKPARKRKSRRRKKADDKKEDDKKEDEKKE